MELKTSFFRKILLVAPVAIVGLCFQNFTEFEVPRKPAEEKAKQLQATSAEGAAEELVRRELPELRNIENRLNDRLQIRWESSDRPENAEVQMNLLDSTAGESKDEGLKLSVVNDKFRVKLAKYDMACDYAPARDLVTLRSNASERTQILFEHSSKDQQSRLNWQLSW